MHCTAIIPSAGSGSRFGGATPKQYLLLAGRPVIAHSVERFLSEPGVDRVVIAVAAEWEQQVREMASLYEWRAVTIVEGGRTRQESVSRALDAIGESDQLVAVHDAVRPMFRRETFRRTLEAAGQYGAAVPVVPVSDTIHRVESDFVVETADRSVWFAAQTPQCFRVALLRRALDEARSAGIEVTDDAAAVRRLGVAVRAVAGDATNLKITREDDLGIAEANFERWSSQ